LSLSCEHGEEEGMTPSMRVEKPSGLKPHAGTKRNADDGDAAVDWERLGKRM
jgi:hypothetical protein